MRSLLYILTTLSVIGLAYWAYNENYATQAAQKRVRGLQADIGAAREKLAVLRAEWAYLNRPDRLRNLAELNFDMLRLMPLEAAHFGDAEQIGFPLISPSNVENPVDLSSGFDKPHKEATE